MIPLAISGCRVNLSRGEAASPTLFIVTATLPPRSAPPPSETPPPPEPKATAPPVKGITSTQVNVRAEPSTASEIVGIIPANTEVEIVGTDPGGNWWQILHPSGIDGKGWVTAQYVTTARKPEVPIVRGGGENPDDGSTAIIQQQINVRSGPGTGFDSIGTLNAQDVVTLTGRDADGTWLQIEFTSGPEGRGWISAAFARAIGAEKLPIVMDAGTVVGTGTPSAIPPRPTLTLVPAATDGDSAESPAANITLSPTGPRSFQYSSDVSSPEGDAEDWIRFTSHSKTILLESNCEGNGSITLEVLQNEAVVQNLGCAEIALLSAEPGAAYTIHISSSHAGGFQQYTLYILILTALP